MAGFEGRAEQVHLQPADGGFAGLVGVGPAAEATATTIRRAGAAVARSCSRHKPGWRCDCPTASVWTVPRLARRWPRA